MKIPFFSSEFMNNQVKESLKHAYEEVFEEQRFSQGSHIRQFEQKFGSYMGNEQFLACANGTDALEIILRVWDIGPGDEVIMPALSCQATLEPVLILGATPVFCDVRPDNFTLDTEKLPSLITTNTKVIVPVHLHGNFALMESILSQVQGTSIKVLEDCAQAHGLFYKGRHAGTFGHAAAFSFYPTKNLGALGEAGGMVFRESDDYQKAFLFRDHGQKSKDVHVLTGKNSRMDTLQAAFLLKKLSFLDEWNKERVFLASQYTDLLKNTGLPAVDVTVWHQYVIRAERRDELQRYLKDKGVGTAVHYPYLLSDYARSAEKFPEAERACREMLSLPLYPGLKKEQQEYIAECIDSFFLTT